MESISNLFKLVGSELGSGDTELAAEAPSSPRCLWLCRKVWGCGRLVPIGLGIRFPQLILQAEAEP